MRLRSIITGLFAIFATREVMARDTDFNPMGHLEVLEHGKTRVASFPNAPVCCSLRAINVPNSFDDYNYGPYSSLHVTSIGFFGQGFMGEDGPYTIIYSSVNHPASFRSFIFEVGNTRREGGESRCVNFLENGAEASSDANRTTTRGRPWGRVEIGPIREAGFTFFARASSIGKTAVMTCYALAPSA